MKKRFVIFMIPFCLVINPLFAKEFDETNSQRGKIILPEVDISIKDESEKEISTNKVSEKTDRRSIDIEELSKIQMSRKFKEEIKEKVDKDFLISMVQVAYGSYGNFLIDMHLGKGMKNVSYLVSYLRNTRDSIGIDTNIFYNTERAIDDLLVEISYNTDGGFSFSGEGGYYNRSIGLFTNREVLSEAKMYIPSKFKMTYTGEEFPSIDLGLNFSYLNLKHKIRDGYSSTNLFETLANISLEKVWGRDNFLNGGIKYLFFYDSYVENSFELLVRDRFPLLSFLSLQFALDLYFYSKKTFFWVPEVYLFYKPDEKFNVKTGLGGASEFDKISKLLEANQIYYEDYLPQEKWYYMAGIYYRPLEYVNFGFEAFFDYYYSYRNSELDENVGLYRIVNLTNVEMMSLSPFLNLIFLEDISFSFGGKISYFDYEKIFLLPAYEVYLNAGYFIRKIGLNLESRLKYVSERRLSKDIVGKPFWKLDFSISQKVKDYFQLYLDLNNLLNCEIFDRVYVPEGGFSFNAGLKFNF